MWRVIEAIVKGAAAVVLVGVLLLFGLFVFFVINPPFKTPETGRLSGSASRDITLAPGEATVAALLETTVNDNAFDKPSGQPSDPAMKLSIAPRDGTPIEGVRIRLLPGEQGQALGEVREVAPHETDWTMPCSEEERKQGCRQRAVVLIEAPPSSSERRWRLSASAYMQYPAFTPTPGSSSIDVALSPLGRENGQGAAPQALASGTVELSMNAPVVVVPLEMSAVGANASSATDSPGAVLRVAFDADVVTEGGPNGLDAPPPVRLSILGGNGAILGRQGVRPGRGGRVLGIPVSGCAGQCPTALAFEWLDRRPETTYHVTWQAEAIGLPVRDAEPARVGLTAAPPVVATSVGAARFPFRDAEALQALEVAVNVAGLPQPGDGLGNLVHAQLLVTAAVDDSTEVGVGPTSITPYPALGGVPGFSAPFHVRPGTSGSIVVNLDDGCDASLCDRWLLRTSGGSTASPTQGLPVTWEFEVRAWRLTGDPAPIPVTLETTVR
jgi:hypothetical protein